MLQAPIVRKQLRSTLKGYPNLNHHEWRQEALSLFSSRSRARYALGLQEVPYPPASAIPSDLPGNAGDAEVATRDRIVKEHITEVDSLAEAEEILLKSIGIDNIRLVLHFRTGTRNVTIRNIMDIMLTTHGSADVATLNEWKSILKASLESGKGFSHLATLHQHYNARLENNGQSESELPNALALLQQYQLIMNIQKPVMITTPPLLWWPNVHSMVTVLMLSYMYLILRLEVLDTPMEPWWLVKELGVLALVVE